MGTVSFLERARSRAAAGDTAGATRARRQALDLQYAIAPAHAREIADAQVALARALARERGGGEEMRALLSAAELRFEELGDAVDALEELRRFRESSGVAPRRY